MATNTYVALKTTTVNTATPSITLDLTGITGYTDLIIVANGTGTNDIDLSARFNGDSGSNYSRTIMSGNGSTAPSTRASNANIMRFNYDGYWTASSRATTIVNIMNYSNTTTYKTVISRSNNAATGTDSLVNLWRSTAAITSLEIFTSAYNFAVGSTFTVYGIASTQAFAKATGGTITIDDKYIYHTFTSSGAFTPLQSLTVDYLVIAGGGAGVPSRGGGGGAGGLRSTIAPTGGGGSAETPLSLTATAYTVTVGAGATAIDGQASGSNSTFSTITSIGGGAGGSPNQGYAPLSGGSGGGGYYLVNGASGTSGQGYAGGNGGVTYIGGAGGGGAGAVGSNASTTNHNGGNGGNGVLNTAWSTITGTGVNGYYAGGGGGGYYTSGGTSGGTGGLGGGGNGKTSSTAAVAGVANTGSGGGSGAGNPGGVGDSVDGANGGSGLVIVRYAR
jgi:hypothetical protein